MAIKYIKAKSILSTYPEGKDEWFGIRYNMNLYRGCQHQCIYCDSRSDCYQVANFNEDLEIKENALELLEKELRSKRKKGTIGFGSMNDPYMHIESSRETVREALKIIKRYRFPIHIITKSNLVLRDIDLITEISKIYATISFSITTFDDKLAEILEPGASPSSERFNAIAELRKNGINSGVIMTPILPFINDTKGNIKNIVETAHKCNTNYIIGWMGLTQRSGMREYFYQKLDDHFPGIRAKYEQTFGDNYSCPSPYANSLQNFFHIQCAKFNIANKIEFYKAPESGQLSLFS